MNRIKILFLDLDDTLIETTSGKSFPSFVGDMKFKDGVLDAIQNFIEKNGHFTEDIFIVSNQGGIELGFVNEEYFEKKIKFVQAAIKDYLRNSKPVEVGYSYCTYNDKNNRYRKPNTGMLDDLLFFKRKDSVEVYKDEMLMVGDASGKPGDFSDSDLRTAQNFGINYMDINDFIKKYTE
jgi:DNA 3'-phosphatase